MKKYIIVSILFWTSVSHAVKITPIKLEATILRKFDGSAINANIIKKIRKYTTQMQQFVHKQYTLSDGVHTLFGLVKLEDASILTYEAQRMLSTMTNEVISFSESFLDQLQGVKKELITVIEEDCANRDRSDSILLKWAHVKEGDEHALFKKEICSYRTLCAFCIDILCFLEDLIYSCPKAMKVYEYEVTRYNTICAHIKVILAENNTLSQSQQKEIIQYITTYYPHDAAITKEKTQELYRKYSNNLKK